MYLNCSCFLQDYPAIVHYEEFQRHTLLAGPGTVLHVPTHPPYTEAEDIGTPPSYRGSIFLIFYLTTLINWILII